MKKGTFFPRISMDNTTSENFANWIIDGIVRVILNAFLPLPVSQKLIVQMKSTIMSIVINLALVLVLVILAIFGFIALPFLTANTSMTKPSVNTDFTSTDFPSQNPMGGAGLSYVTITAYFHDPAYFAQFGVQHEGVDMVPNNTYYQQSNVYQKNKPAVVIFATNNGTIQNITDQYEVNGVTDTNPEGNLQSEYLHLDKVYVHSGEQVTAGTPVGTMGDTGFSTGPHLHYQINMLENGSWTPTDPLQYIQ